MQKTVQVGLIQMTCGDNIAANYAKAVACIRQAADQGAQIVCLQELFKSRYFCQVVDNRLFDLAEEVTGASQTVRELGELAEELGIVIIAGLFEKRAAGMYHNAAVVLDADGSYLGKYRKMHIPDDPGYYEKFYFAPGDLGYRIFRTRYAKVGVLICWDQWYPEAARMLALKGAEIIFIPTAIGYPHSEEVQVTEYGYHDAWQIVQRGHAVANACFVAAVNRVGFEEEPQGNDGIDFWGQSFLADPFGELVAKASATREQVLVAPADLSKMAEIRTGWSFPFRDRRVDSYGGLTELYLDSGAGS
ncbi:MAG: carbon-nitrogen hydrolase [Anaerolineae bacterium]|jgi:N-carbamoylputrescine amidase